MLIYPAIDLYEGKAVRLYRGDYARMTVYSAHPVEVARDFARQGATHMHVVDLEGARGGSTPNLDTVREIARSSGLFVECGGGLRSLEAVEAGLQAFMENQQASFQNYLADQYEIALSARLETLDDGTVVMVMCEGQDTVFDAIVSAIEAA